MHCPRCEMEVLDERERDGVTIDICPSCRGVWLDRGELERLIARADGGPPSRSRDERPRPDDRYRGEVDDRRFERRREREDDDDDDDDDDNRRGRGRGFFGSLRDLFD